MRIHLFIPCLVDQIAPETATATKHLLERYGYQVIVDRRQTCCGQALFNAGFRQEARELAQRFIRIFSQADAVVAPSGSCVSMVVNHYAELGLTGQIFRDWELLRQRTFELCRFLVNEIKIVDTGAHFPHRVTYHPSCHYLRDYSEREAPRELLSNVKGIELIEGDWSDECCGFGGAFSAKYSSLSQRIADRRAITLAQGNAEIVTGVDDSCLNHLDKSFKRLKLPLRTLHIARILNFYKQP